MSAQRQTHKPAAGKLACFSENPDEACSACGDVSPRGGDCAATGKTVRFSENPDEVCFAHGDTFPQSNGFARSGDCAASGKSIRFSENPDEVCAVHSDVSPRGSDFSRKGGCAATGETVCFSENPDEDCSPHSGSFPQTDSFARCGDRAATGEAVCFSENPDEACASCSSSSPQTNGFARNGDRAATDELASSSENPNEACASCGGSPPQSDGFAPRIKAVVFDMDGVLLDTETISFKAWELAAADFGIRDIAAGNAACMGANKADATAILRKVYGAGFAAEKFLARTSECFRQIESERGVGLMPFAEEALQKLGAKYVLALATSTRRARAEEQLKNARLDVYFKTKTYGDMVAHSKPDPEIYEMACKSLGLAPAECVAVEDSPNGIRSAFAAGMKAVMVPDKIRPDGEMRRKCWKICKNLAELAERL